MSVMMYEDKDWEAFVRSLNLTVGPAGLQLMDSIHTTAHAIHRACESNLSATGLSYARFRLLMSLMICEEVDGRFELHPSEISDRQGTSRNTVSTHISSLEDQGLIERRLDKDDLRRFNIRLTEAGRELVREHAGRHFAIITDCFADLAVHEQEMLRLLLEKIRFHMDGCEQHLRSDLC